MGLTFVVALVSTAGTGLVAEATRTTSRAEAHEQLADQDVRLELVEMGFAPPSSPALAEVAASLRTSHGVELMVASDGFAMPLPNGEVVGRQPSSDQTARTVVRVADELRRYPASFLRAAGLWRVVLCASLRESGRGIPSLPNVKHSLLLDVAAHGDYLPRLLHHEVFHFADYADDDVVAFDAEWSALNPRGFTYGPGGRAVRGRGAGSLVELDGFVSVYATSALEEDKAELFAVMMTQPAWLARRLEADAILALKHAHLLRLVAGLSPEMGPSYWR